MKWSRVPDDRPPQRTAWCSIVGAPRCGTTSLARYLSGHPDILLSSVKEPHFFSRRDLRSWPTADVTRFVRKDYVEHFFPGQTEREMLLDGSVSYLYAPERLEPALRLWPSAKFIIMVRNPLEMLPSLHQRLICTGDEDVQDFEQAWSLVAERRSGRHIPRCCIDPRLLDYEEIGRLGKHLANFFEVVGRERCFVSVFDDLVQDPAKQYAEIVDFLGLPPDTRAEFPAFRARTGVRSAALQRLLKRPPKAARPLLASAADLHRDGRSASKHSSLVMKVRKRLLNWNKSAARPVQLPGRLREEIRAALADDVAVLSGLLGRDLTQWMARANRQLETERPVNSPIRRAWPALGLNAAASAGFPR
jgi:hypothetical protein